MIEIVIKISYAILILSTVLVIIRMIKGPFIMDRIMSMDGISVSLMGILALLSIHWKSAHFIDVLLIFSLINFLSTVAFVSYLSKRLKQYSHKKKEEFE